MPKYRKAQNAEKEPSAFCNSGKVKSPNSQIKEAGNFCPFSLTKTEVAEILRQEFPLLEKFYLWETFELNNDVQHLYGKNTIFLYVEEEAAYLTCFFRSRKINAFYDPTQKEFLKFVHFEFGVPLTIRDIGDLSKEKIENARKAERELSFLWFE